MSFRAYRAVTVASLCVLACSGAVPSVFGPSDGGPETGDDGAATGGTPDGGAPGMCSAVTCAFGCCQGGGCVTPTVDTACGVFGAACQDCTTSGRMCQFGACGGRRVRDAGPG
jgi:hypothetical protein